MTLTARPAVTADLPLLRPLVDAAIGELQRGFLTEAQIAASRAVMGVDTQLVLDGTYLVVEDVAEGPTEGTPDGGGRLVGCGGWSRRATLYGADHSAGRDAALLDPRTDAARVRAMYTHPDFARRGVGALILRRCEAAAAAEGFTRLELMATLSGRPLYTAAGFVPLEDVLESVDGVTVPLTRMTKAIAAAPR
jgi:GNAT superfamily N-acetyltransferase